MGIETYTTPGYDVDASIALKIRPSQPPEELNVEEELQEKSYAFYRIMAIVMAMIPFWLLFLLPFKMLVYEAKVLDIADTNVFTMLQNFFTADSSGNYILGVLPILAPEGTLGGVANGAFLYLIVLSIPVCFVLSLVAALFKKSSPALLRTILCVDIFVFTGYLLSLYCVGSFHQIEASAIDTPSLIVIALDLILYLVLSGIKCGKRFLFGFFSFLLTVASIGALYYGISCSSEAATALIAEKDVYKTLASVMTIFCGIALFFATAGIAAKKLRGRDIFFSFVLMYLGLRLNIMASLEKAFPEMATPILVSALLAWVLLMSQMSALNRLNKKDPKNASVLLNAEMARRQEEEELAKVRAWQEKIDKKEAKKAKKQAKKAKKAAKKQAKKDKKANAKQKRLEKKIAKFDKKQAKLAAKEEKRLAKKKPEKELSPKAAKKAEKKEAKKAKKHAKAVAKLQKKKEKVEKQLAKEIAKKEAKAAKAEKKAAKKASKGNSNGSPFCGLLAFIFALIPVGVFYAMETTSFDGDFAAKSVMLLDVVKDLFARELSVKALPLINDITLYIVVVATALTALFGLAAIIAPKSALKQMRKIFSWQGFAFGTYAIVTALTAMYGGASLTIDTPAIIVTAVALLGLIVTSALSNGKRTFYGLLVYLLTLASVGSILYAIGSNAVDLRKLYDTRRILRTLTLYPVCVFALILLAAYRGIPAKKTRAGGIFRSIILIYFASRVILFAILRSAYENFLTFGIISMAAALLLLMVESIALKAEKKAALLEKYKNYKSASEEPAPVALPVEAPVEIPDTTIVYKPVAPRMAVVDVPAPAPVATTPAEATANNSLQDLDLYGLAFDPFIGTLTFEERKEFIYLFMMQPFPDVPTYVVGGDNKVFFRKVFVHLGLLRSKISDALMEKIYQFAIRLN